MDNSTLAIYIHELRNQCLYMQASLEVFNQSLTQKMGTGALFGAQASLYAAAQIALVLYPTRARHRRRGEELRKVLGLPEKHAFADRRISEVMENSDQKLEDWISRSKNERVIIDFIGPVQSIQLPEGETLKDDNIYRLYDPQTKVFLYRGIGYNLENLAKAVVDIMKRVDYIYQQMMPQQQQQAKAADTSDAPELATQTAAASQTEGAADTTNQLGDFAPADPAAKVEPIAKEAKAEPVPEKPKRAKPTARKSKAEKAKAE